ncbi:hypothetical protein NL108_018520 [Boleophthalmus pectinirostris]|uniref:B2 bradykinin receptor-like n=1 Tax=Boleophthalmus pectinirostris TaxID=150288 RepID=UPI0024304CA2|nr:B2 bradykinin receptor-like [Boleophthalmus pectinirostris]KAJ0051301.1 hypothetical protein NL108_018520 [Boleophthalmus pectinirostris]
MDTPTSFPNTTEQFCDHDALNTSWIPPYIYIISALGIPLNLLVLLVFLLHKKKCSVTEIYLCNMAAADLLLMLFMPFWGVYQANDHVWTFGGPMCTLASLLMVMNYNCSIYFLVLVCVDRFLALVHPLTQCKLHRRKYAMLGCFLAWCLGLLLNIPTLMCKRTAVSDNIEEPTCQWGCFLSFYFTHELIQTIAAFVLPFLIILFCTVKIVQALTGRPPNEGRKLQKEHKATVLVLSVLLAFFVCWFPFSLVRMIELAVRYNLIEETCSLVHHLYICRVLFINFGFSNSDLNPILYVIVGKHFRKKMSEVVGGRESFKMSSTRFTTSSVKGSWKRRA